MTEELKKERKAKETAPYIVGQWLPDGKFKPCDKQPETPITDFNEIVRWTRASFDEAPDTYSFVRRAPKSLTLCEQKTIKGTLV